MGWDGEWVPDHQSPWTKITVLASQGQGPPTMAQNRSWPHTGPELLWKPEEERLWAPQPRPGLSGYIAVCTNLQGQPL